MFRTFKLLIRLQGMCAWCVFLSYLLFPPILYSFKVDPPKFQRGVWCCLCTFFFSPCYFSEEPGVSFCRKPCKVGTKYLEDGTKVRVSRGIGASGSIIPRPEILKIRSTPRPTVGKLYKLVPPHKPFQFSFPFLLCAIISHSSSSMCSCI